MSTEEDRSLSREELIAKYQRLQREAYHRFNHASKYGKRDVADRAFCAALQHQRTLEDLDDMAVH